MGYQEDCEWFALHGDPAMEAMEHEMGAREDYLREAYGDTAYDCAEEEYAEVMAGWAKCAACKALLVAPTPESEDDIPF